MHIKVCAYLRVLFSWPGQQTSQRERKKLKSGICFDISTQFTRDRLGYQAYQTLVLESILHLPHVAVLPLAQYFPIYLLVFPSSFMLNQVLLLIDRLSFPSSFVRNPVHLIILCSFIFTLSSPSISFIPTSYS